MKELRDRETSSDILLDCSKNVFKYTVQISIISSILLFRRANSLPNIRNKNAIKMIVLMLKNS